MSGEEGHAGYSPQSAEAVEITGLVRRFSVADAKMRDAALRSGRADLSLAAGTPPDEDDPRVQPPRTDKAREYEVATHALVLLGCAAAIERRTRGTEDNAVGGYLRPITKRAGAVLALLVEPVPGEER